MTALATDAGILLQFCCEHFFVDNLASFLGKNVWEFDDGDGEEEEDLIDGDETIDDFITKRMKKAMKIQMRRSLRLSEDCALALISFNLFWVFPEF